eukprot:336224-Heterocapsa_arctica.AAC.1
MSPRHPAQTELLASVHGRVTTARTLGDLHTAISDDPSVLMRLDGWKPKEIDARRVSAIQVGPPTTAPILVARNRVLNPGDPRWQIISGVKAAISFLSAAENFITWRQVIFVAGGGIHSQVPGPYEGEEYGEAFAAPP